jgi:A/G-specific adenine glycosylase
MSGDGLQAGEMSLPAGFGRRLIDWQRVHGRSGLPWQHTRDPYRVWLSEVMLQQTQVSTVLVYFPRFLKAFPDVSSLAEATQDEVMALWAGLGYYSRARNLHRCAQAVVQQHAGVFPRSAQELETLPGIGASTAAAIAAFCFGERVSIVDGNVRRVLSRLLDFDQDLALSGSQRALWALAQRLLPLSPTHSDMTAYTQGLMDLGATVCLRSQPKCDQCPVRSLCRAHGADTVGQRPMKSRTVKRRHESWWLLLLVGMPESQGAVHVWLERRPSPGIWAGLYCTPVYGSESGLLDAVPAGWRDQVLALEAVAHSLTHRELRLHPLLLDVGARKEVPMESDGQWVAIADLPSYGLPAPIRTLIATLSSA